MPELPEVETVRCGLAELLPGRVVARAVVFDSPKSFPNAPSDVEQFLYGARVGRADRLVQRSCRLYGNHGMARCCRHEPPQTDLHGTR